MHFPLPTLGIDYAYAYGRIGVLKQLLLTQTDLDRLLGAPGSKELEQIFLELPITNPIDQGLQGSENILRAVARWIRTEVERMAPAGKEPVFHILWLEADAPYLSYLVKQHHGLTSEISQEPEPVYSAYPPEKLRRLVQQNAVNGLPSHLVELVQRLNTLQNPAPNDIDTEVARHFAGIKLRLARTSGNPDIERFVRHLIDISNVRTRLRSSEPHLLWPGGTIAVADLARSKDGLIQTVKQSKIAPQMAEIIGSEHVDAHRLEQIFADILAKDTARLWNVPLTVSPLFAFAYVALTHVKILRMILIGKRNGLSPQEIKAALPPFLPATHYIR